MTKLKVGDIMNWSGEYCVVSYISKNGMEEQYWGYWRTSKEAAIQCFKQLKKVGYKELDMSYLPSTEDINIVGHFKNKIENWKERIK